MMRKKSIILFGAALLTLALFGFGVQGAHAQTATITRGPKNQTFNINVGQSVELDFTGHSIGFQTLVECEPTSNFSGDPGGSRYSVSILSKSDGTTGATIDYMITGLNPGTEAFKTTYTTTGDQKGAVCGGAPASDSDSAENTIVVTSVPVNGSCGTANTHSYGSADSIWGGYSACSAGSANPSSISITPGETGSWKCMGSGGGTTASCVASRNAPLTVINMTPAGGEIKSMSSPDGIPAGINCPGNCVADFHAGESVTLTAIPAAGYYFTGWGGNCAASGTSTSCILTMNQAQSVSADFEQGPPTLTVSPSSATVTAGDTVSFTAMYDPDGASGPAAATNVTNGSSWSSSDPAVASISSSSGIAEGQASGSATIKANYNGYGASANLSVTQPIVISCPTCGGGGGGGGGGPIFNLNCSGGSGTYIWTSTGSPTPPPPTGTDTYDVSYDSPGVYTVTCKDSLGDPPGVLTITVAGPSCSSFTATPDSVVPPQTTQLNWSCSNVQFCKINGGRSLNGVGSSTEAPTSTTTYTLDCSGYSSGPGNEVSLSTTVTVQNPGIIEINP